MRLLEDIFPRVSSLSPGVSLVQRACDFMDGQAGLGLSVWCKHSVESMAHSFVWFSFWVWTSHSGSHFLRVLPRSSFMTPGTQPLCYSCRSVWVKEWALESQKFGLLARWHRLPNQAFQVQSPNLLPVTRGTLNLLISLSLYSFLCKSGMVIGPPSMGCCEN